MSSRFSLKIHENDEETASQLCDFVIQQANDAIGKRGIFTVGLSGGSMAKFLCAGLAERTTDWSKWRVFFCDERHVPHDDSECTYNIYKHDLMSRVPLTTVYPDNPDIPVDKAASEYEKHLVAVFGSDGMPRFDLVLLGMGPDGHTCSLFPGHQLLQEDTRWVRAISDSPKPPPERITFTLPLLNNARCAVFASCGQGKATMVKEVLEGDRDPPLPASMVQPTDGKVVWFLDQLAASLLSQL